MDNILISICDRKECQQIGAFLPKKLIIRHESIWPIGLAMVFSSHYTWRTMPLYPPIVTWTQDGNASLDMIGFNFWLVFAQSASFQRWLGTSVENLRRNLILNRWIILFRALGNPHKSQFDAPCSPQAIGGTIYHTPRRQGETSEHRTFYWKMTHLTGFESVYTVSKFCPIAVKSSMRETLSHPKVFKQWRIPWYWIMECINDYLYVVVIHVSLGAG